MFCDWKSRWTRTRGKLASRSAICFSRRQARQFMQLLLLDAEMAAEAILEKIMLLPKVKRRVELRWQIGPDLRRVSRGDAVQLRDFFER